VWVWQRFCLESCTDGETNCLQQLLAAVWNIPHEMGYRLQRALQNAAWACAGVLLLLSVWGVGRETRRLTTLHEAHAATSASIAQLEQHALTIERSLLGLAHADHPKVRYVGYEPESLWRALQHARREANKELRALEARTAHYASKQIHESLMQLRAAWLQLDTELGEYRARGQPEQVSLSTLRVFSLERQSTFVGAIDQFRHRYQRAQQAIGQRVQGNLIGHFVLCLVGVGLLGGLAWWRWVAPAQWLRAALDQSEQAHRASARLQATEWGELYQRLRLYEQRLREAERFMHDLALGRTPAPLTPTDAADPLARSSRWLLQRLEQGGSIRTHTD
jgi:hypothetical protein